MELCWWVQAEVEAGVAQGEDGVPERLEAGEFTPRRLWRSLVTNVMVLVGWLYYPTEVRSTTLFDLFGLWQPSDPEGKFCRRVVDYCFRARDNKPCDSPRVRATSTDIHDFVQSCRDAYTDLGEEERGLLAPYRATGVIPEVVLFRNDTPTLMEQGQAHARAKLPADDGEGRRVSREELVKVLNDSLQDSLLSEIISSPPEEVINAFSEFNVAAVPTIPSDWAEVGHALRYSQIVRFDSTPLLPPELFNMSMEQLAHNEGAAADRIPVLPALCAPMSLRSYTVFAESHVATGKKGAFSFASWEIFGLEKPKGVPARMVSRMRRSSLERSGADVCHTINVNVRRLPRLFSLLPERLEKSLGLEEEILRMQPYLWLGPVTSTLHYDEDTSLYIQLSGHADAIVFEQSHTDFLGPGYRNSKQFDPHDPLFKIVPSHLLHLRPGDGLVMPSRSYHVFVVQCSHRIALNFFIQPRWRRIESSKDSWQAREARKELGLQHLALRQLFWRSLIRLYEKTGKGIFFLHNKNELL